MGSSSQRGVFFFAFETHHKGNVVLGWAEGGRNAPLEEKTALPDGIVRAKQAKRVKKRKERKGKKREKEDMIERERR